MGGWECKWNGRLMPCGFSANLTRCSTPSGVLCYLSHYSTSASLLCWGANSLARGVDKPLALC